jgi:hypothetical protein
MMGTSRVFVSWVVYVADNVSGSGSADILAVQRVVAKEEIVDANLTCS